MTVRGSDILSVCKYFHVHEGAYKILIHRKNVTTVHGKRDKDTLNSI